MSWIEFLGWQQRGNRRALERRNAQARSEAGLPPAKKGPSNSEWQAYQQRILEAQGGDEP